MFAWNGGNQFILPQLNNEWVGVAQEAKDLAAWNFDVWLQLAWDNDDRRPVVS